MSIVSVVKGENRRENIKKTLAVLPNKSFTGLQEAEIILIKPNLAHHRNQLASTHVDAVRGVIDFIRSKTKARIIVADASFYDTKAAFRNFGYENLLHEYTNVQLFDLNNDETVVGEHVKHDGFRRAIGLSKQVSKADFTISLAPIKLHPDIGVSMSLYNWSIGVWVAKEHFGSTGKYWPRWSDLKKEGSLAYNLSLIEILNQMRPNLAILDGFIGMEGDGPIRGRAIELEIALASVDLISLDATACRVIGVDPDEIEALVLANQKGYGTIKSEEIELRGITNLTSIKKVFKKPSTWQSHNFVGQMER